MLIHLDMAVWDLKVLTLPGLAALSTVLETHIFAFELPAFVAFASDGLSRDRCDHVPITISYLHYQVLFFVDFGADWFEVLSLGVEQQTYHFLRFLGLVEVL